jgi:hypothetical protein
MRVSLDVDFQSQSSLACPQPSPMAWLPLHERLMRPKITQRSHTWAFQLPDPPKLT